MLITLILISANVHSSVDAPKGRGFSFIEIWFFGTTIPILVAILEYGYVLHLIKNHKARTFSEKKKQVSILGIIEPDDEAKFTEKIRKLDYSTMTICLSVLFLFVIIYLLVAMSKIK